MADGAKTLGSVKLGTKRGLSGEDLRRFGLEMNPFSSNHDSKFLLRSSPLRRALKALRGFLDAETRLMVIVGEPGVGKTAAIDAMSREIEDGIRTARIMNPPSSWSELGQEIGEQLKLSRGRLSPGSMVADQVPAQTYRVIVDRAEQLGEDSVKHLGAYLDLKASEGRQVHRLQIVLVAREVTSAPVFTWLSDRAHSRIELATLQPEQTRDYVDRRVQIAQLIATPIFSSDALDRIADAAGGNPRSINRLCSAALTLAASRGSSTVDAETVGTASRRLSEGASPAAASAIKSSAPAAAMPAPEVNRNLPPDSFDELLEEPSVSTRVAVLETEASKSNGRSHAALAVLCVVLLGVIAGGAAFLYFNQPPPPEPPIVQIIEVPVEKIVEVPVEVLVEVVKIVEVEVPVKPKPRAPKPQPKKIAKVVKVVPPPAKPAPKPEVVPEKPELGPIPPAATVLDRAFAKSYPGDHTRMVEIFQHGKDGVTLTQTLKLARIKRKSRTLTIGVLTGDVSSDVHEVESRFLSIETGALEDERFGYRPASGTVEHLKGGRGEDPFYGNSFHYDDFRVRQSKHYLIHSIERTQIEDQYFYSVSAKPRFRAAYERVDFIVDSQDYALVEIHFFQGLGLRPYRILQYPRSDMKAIGRGLVPMRMISRDFRTNRIDEARVVKVKPGNRLDPKLFTLTRMRDAKFEIPNL
ncbi:MAG: outer membrane lipoprotein-sorting protein [Myxococcales bacterium]|nr:outer membrane lipoprotein-sorting protein [Myxococcales bacterium]